MARSEKVELVSVTKDGSGVVSAFLKLGRDYLSDCVVAHDLPPDERERFLQSILARQGEPDRWLFLLRYGNEYVGFVHMKIDRDDRPGWGVLMEFYIVPNKRKLGLGRRLFNLIVEILQARGVRNIWLTTASNAEQFWFSLGFKDTGEIDGRNNLKIMVTSI